MANLQRLDQILSSLGYCSRREAKDWIKKGRVRHLDNCALKTSLKVDPHQILIDDEPLDHPQGLLVLLNKPAGFVCSHESREGSTVYELLPPRWLNRNPRIETIGRLDKDTTGVLLFTDQGPINHRWTSPKHHVDKRYHVTTDLPISKELIPEFASGNLLLDGESKTCRPAALSLISENTAHLSLVEGKFHQVKRMFEHFGLTVTRLHRESFGQYVLHDLDEGKFQIVPIPEL